MEETQITHPGVPEEQYHTLGVKTFWIFFLQRVQPAFILLLLTIAAFVISQQSFLMTKQFGNLAPYALDATLLLGLLFIVFLAIGAFSSWLSYSRFKFCLGEDSLKIKKGVLNKEEVAIP